MTLEKRLNDAFEEMMSYRTSVGYATATYRSSVPPFINFCVENYSNSELITPEMIDKWGSSRVMVGENHPHPQYLC